MTAQKQRIGKTYFIELLNILAWSKSMTEAQFQSTLIKRYEAEGWYVTKLIQCNKTGMPDLILTKPDEVRWVEVKADKGRLSPVQEYRHAELRALGYTVEVVRPLI
jgi:hypothetical protein